MVWVQVLLWVNGLAFIGYGVACLFVPALPAGQAGFDLGTASGTVEVIAMYGGLQTGFGVFLILGALEPSLRRTVVLALAVVVGGLATARLFGLALHGPSTYNLGAVGYEATVAVLATWALRRAASVEAPA